MGIIDAGGDGRAEPSAIDNASDREARVERAALVAGLVTVVLWASAFVGIRAVAIDLSPGTIALGRLGIGSILLVGLVARRGWVQPSRRDLALVVAMGIVWSAGYSILLGAGERLVDAGTAAMLVGIGPIFIAVLAGLFLAEGFPARLLTGCLIAFCGTAIIGVATATGAGGASSILAGVALCIAAAFLYAVGVTLQKPALKALPGIQVTWLACVVGAVACLPFAPGLASELGRARPETLAWLLYLGVFPTSIGFSTWAFALARMTAGRAGTLSYLVSPTAIVISWLVLGATPALLAIAGGALCVIGVVVARSTSRSTRVPRPSASRTAT
jgi:drug/metabolite transporter (DMT)-like permease